MRGSPSDLFCCLTRRSTADIGPILPHSIGLSSHLGCLVCTVHRSFQEHCARERHFLEVLSAMLGMLNEDKHVSDDGCQDGGGSSQESARDITDCLLQSPAALEALGRGLLPALSPLMSQPSGGPGRSRVSHLSNIIITPGTHAPQPFHLPWYPPFPMYGPPSYGRPFPYPMMGGYPYGQQDRYDHGTPCQSKSSLPGNPGCAPQTSSSSQEDGERLLASGPSSRVDDQEDVDSWQYLVDPFLSQEERNSLDPEASEQGDPEAEEEITGTSDGLQYQRI